MGKETIVGLYPEIVYNQKKVTKYSKQPVQRLHISSRQTNLFFVTVGSN